MAKHMTKLGFIATALLILLLGFNALREPNRQEEELDEQQIAAIARATELYAINCVECHGPSGEGLNLNPALNDPAVRAKDATELAKTISRGRTNTAMVAFSIDENGILTAPQINDLVTLIKHARWRDIELYIDEHDLRPVELPSVEAQFDIAKLTYPLEIVSEGRTIYLSNCFSCHNAGAAGVTSHRIGKDLSDNAFVRDNNDEDLLTFIQEGRSATDPDNVTGYEMPARGGNPNLSDADILKTIAYMKELNNNTVIGDMVVAADTTATWNNITYHWVEVASNFDIPLGLVNAGDGSGRLFVLEQIGRIMVIDQGKLLPEPFLEITDLLPDEIYHGSYTEQGLLGMVFHPQYAENGLFFISYTDRAGDSVLARYSVSPDNPNRADPNSAVILLTVDQPFNDHNGGNVAFGPDGYLYMAFGDGGRPSEPNYNSQEPNLYLGKMLRLNVDAETYTVPPDNPFVNNPDFLPEIWALGLRNPWRFSFDRKTGDLYIADVGQWHYEEIDFQPAGSPGGQNYGWSAFEAMHPYLEDETVLGEHTLPIIEYGHDAGLSITGGFVYRGPTLPGLHGVYFYGDYVNGMIWIAYQDDATGAWQTATFMDSPFVISSFGEDEQGELYLVDYKGSVYRLEHAEPQPDQASD